MKFAAVAQQEERRFCTPVVVGSIPASGLRKEGLMGCEKCICETCGTIWDPKERQELLDFKNERLEQDLKKPAPETVDVDFHEYECGMACTPNGCLGHDTDIPIAFSFRGVWFEVAGYREGEVPWDGPGGVKDLKEYKEVFDAMTERLSR